MCCLRFMNLILWMGDKPSAVTNHIGTTPAMQSFFVQFEESFAASVRKSSVDRFWRNFFVQFLTRHINLRDALLRVLCAAVVKRSIAFSLRTFHEPRDESTRFALVLFVGFAFALDRTHFGVGDAGDKE